MAPILPGQTVAILVADGCEQVELPEYRNLLSSRWPDDLPVYTRTMIPGAGECFRRATA